MGKDYMELHDEEEVLALLEVQSTQLIMFDNEYCVYRYAGEPATDVMVDVDTTMLFEMWQADEIKCTILECGMSYKKR